jgi:hypothetical protein
MLPDTDIDDVKKQRNAEYAKHINDPVLSSLEMDGIRLLYFFVNIYEKAWINSDVTNNFLFIIIFVILTCIWLSRGLFCMTLGTVPHHTWRHTGAIVRYWYIYRVSRDAFRSFSKRYPSYALRKHICGSGLWEW